MPEGKLKCPICGYESLRGTDGAHQCVDELKAQNTSMKLTLKKVGALAFSGLNDQAIALGACRSIAEILGFEGDSDEDDFMIRIQK